MQAKFTQASDFRQERDFGAKIGATFEFLGAHWRPLGKCLVYFVLPLALVMGVAVGIFQSQIFDTVGHIDSAATRPGAMVLTRNLDRLSGTYWLGMGVMALTYLVLMGTVYGYIYVRINLPAEEEVTPALVGQQVRRLSPKFIVLSILVLLATMLGMILLFVPGIYLSVALSLAWAVQTFEGRGATDSIKRNLQLIRGKWWSTLGLSFVMSLIIGLLSLVFQLPTYLAMAGKMLHWSALGSDILMIFTSTLASVGQMVLYTPLFVALSFQYFNLVERKEGVGLRGLVDSLGTAPAPVAYSHAHRPDDEGEY